MDESTKSYGDFLYDNGCYKPCQGKQEDGDKLIQYDAIAVNTIVKNRDGAHAGKFLASMQLEMHNLKSAFISENGITEFYIVGADAAACVKSASCNMVKTGYIVHVLSDCITSYDKGQLAEMLEYYAGKGCMVEKPDEVI